MLLNSIAMYGITGILLVTMLSAKIPIYDKFQSLLLSPYSIGGSPTDFTSDKTDKRQHSWTLFNSDVDFINSEETARNRNKLLEKCRLKHCKL